MKECKYCGTSYGDKLNICPNCGASVVITAAERKLEKEQAAYEKTLNSDNNNRLRFLIWGGMALLVIIIILVTLSVVASLNRRYVYTNASGLNVEVTRREIRDAVELGESYAEQQEYIKAIEQYNKVPEEYSGYESVQDKKDEAIAGYSDKKISEAEELLADGKYTDAVAVLNAANREVGESKIFELKIEAMLVQYKNDMIAKVDALLVEEKYDEALTVLDSAATVAGKSTEFTKKEDEVLELYRIDFINRANEYLSDRKYTEALAALSTAQEIFGSNDSTITGKIKEVNKIRILEKIEELEESKSYSEAINYIYKEEANISNDAQIKEKLNAIKSMYTAQVLETAEVAFEEEGYQRALGILHEANVVLSGSDEIYKAIADYEDYAPIRISSLDYYTYNYKSPSFANEYKDNYGDIQPNVTYGNFGADYYLDGEYKRLSGTLFRTYKERAESNSPSLTIKCDGKEVFSKTIAIGDKPVPFEVDLTGVEVVLISFHGVYTSLWPTDYYLGGISEFNIYKK